LPIETPQASLIVTSPPYVTSYEYADLHQLTAFWLKYCESLAQFRRPFIGSAYAKRDSINLQSVLAENIVEQLGNNKKAQEVRHYFADMLECFQEMQRVLKPGGKACIVIGNTKLNGVPILNAEVFGEQMRNIGFTPVKVIKREISSKMLPQTRDSNTGRFTSAVSQSKVLAYPIK
jgi:DNA modification methylase